MHLKLLQRSLGNGFRVFCLTCLVVLVFHHRLNAQWYVDACGGAVYNIPTSLSIYQDGEPTIKMLARFRTEPFTLPVYWDIRLGKASGCRLLEAELIHHKLYLDNPNAQVQKFNVSHGFNILLVNYGYIYNRYRFRVGLGVVIAHPESKIRDLEFGSSTDDWDMGYYLTGPAFSVSADRFFTLTKAIFFAVGTKTTVSVAKVPVSSGYARFTNIAAHLNFGLGVRF